METNNKIKVLNRSQSIVIYNIKEKNIRREFAPGEVKMLPWDELEALTFQPGGKELIEGYLLISDASALDTLGIETELEYKLTNPEIIELIKNGSLNSFIDCLNFAPVGVLDTIKSLAVSLPLNDSNKRDAIKNNKRTNFNVDLAIKHDKESKETSRVEPKPAERLVAPVSDTPARLAVPQYNVVPTK